MEADKESTLEETCAGRRVCPETGGSGKARGWREPRDGLLQAATRTPSLGMFMIFVAADSAPPWLFLLPRSGHCAGLSIRAHSAMMRDSCPCSTSSFLLVYEGFMNCCDSGGNRTDLNLPITWKTFQSFLFFSSSTVCSSSS